MKITVLYGGPSDEREISIVSGKAVAEGLRAMGHEVFESDVGPENLSALDRPADVIFPVLHGRFGEDGELQHILEQRKLPFVGSGSAASRVAMDKVQSKRAWEQAGLLTAPWELMPAGDCAAGQLPARIRPPAVVKPPASGSSIDVYICQTNGQLKAACQKVGAKHGSALIEKFIKGVEITVGVLRESALPPIRIKAPGEFYDFDAKYKGQATEYHLDTGLPEQVVAQAQEIALRAHRVLGCRDLSRVDMMIDPAHQAYLLEINTLPGFTPRSLLPKAAAHAGIDFGHLVDQLARAARDRHAQAAG